MSPSPPMHNWRILIIDDNTSIHEAMRKVLTPKTSGPPLEEAEAAIFGQQPLEPTRHEFEVESAFQGEEGLACVKKAVAANKPFALAFVDVRMPPGMDGIETIRHLWAVDPDLQIVICTAYSDYSFDELARRLGRSDRALLLKKPFDVAEVLQLAYTLTEKWRLLHESRSRMDELDCLVFERTQALRASNEKLLHELAERKRVQARISAFASLGQGLSAAKTVREAALVITEVADQLLGWDACTCDLYSSEQDTVQHVLAVDVINGTRAHCTPFENHKPPMAFNRRAIRDGGFFLCRENPQFTQQDGIPFGDTARPSASLMFVPIRNAQRIIGVLSIQSYKPNAYHQDSLETLQALADHCGGALDRIRSEETLQATQEQLRQAQKMEAIGQLAGGIAHDFNNVLAVIRGNAELITMQGQELTKPITDCLGQITSASDRAANLARQLLTFSRKQMMQARPIGLNELVMNLTKMLKRIMTEAIDVQCHYRAQLPAVKADAGMIEQVLMNLAVNARDAMPGGGRLEISTGLECVDAASVPAHPDGRAGEFVYIAVKDSGTGIAPENMSHLFEPFFTTKDVGKGTGLGLATVYGIVKQHEGWIEVSSQLGEGSTFKFFLPALPRPAEPSAPKPVRATPVGGTETIMLVEDESSVRLMARRLLEGNGYRVCEAASGPEALRRWDAGERADLLLTDVVMPDGLNGRELAEQLRRKEPRLKVIYMSAYIGGVLDQDTESLCQKGDFFLQKPFFPADLLQTLRRCLDGVNGSRRLSSHTFAEMVI